MAKQTEDKKMNIPKVVTVNISTSAIFKVLIIGLILAFLWYIKEIVIMLFIAVLLAALIEPFTDWFNRKKIPRGLAVFGIYVVLLSLLAISLMLVIPPVIDQTQQLWTNFSSIFVSASEYVNHIYAFGEKLGIDQNIASGIDILRGNVGGAIGNIFSTLTGFITGVISFLIVLVLAFYIVVEEDAWRRLFRRIAPDEYQPYLAQLFTKMQKKIGLWLRGELILMFTVGLASYLGLLILGVEYALVLAVFTGLLEIIPYAGPTISAILAVFIAFVDSPIKAVMVLLLYIIIQQLENNILIPKIMQKVTGLNPIVSIVALLIGFKVGGIAGAILAIPVATVASVFFYDVFKKEE